MKNSPFPRDPAKRLARRVPLADGKELERGESRLERRTRMRQVSARREAENRQRRKMVRELWPERPACAVYELSQARPGLVPDNVIAGCGRWADDVHEPLTRARGGDIADPGNAIPPCRACHDVLTFTPDSELGWAYDAGLLVHSWDAPGAGGAA